MNRRPCDGPVLALPQCSTPSRAPLLAILLAAFAAGSAWADEPTGLARWARTALLAEPPLESPGPAGIELVRQDHGILGCNRSSRDTAPLRLAKKRYEHGLGTHSVSQILVRLDRPAARFEAEAGVARVGSDAAGPAETERRSTPPVRIRGRDRQQKRRANGDGTTCESTSHAPGGFLSGS